MLKQSEFDATSQPLSPPMPVTCIQLLVVKGALIRALWQRSLPGAGAPQWSDTLIRVEATGTGSTISQSGSKAGIPAPALLLFGRLPSFPAPFFDIIRPFHLRLYPRHVVFSSVSSCCIKRRERLADRSPAWHFRAVRMRCDQGDAVNRGKDVSFSGERVDTGRRRTA